MKRSPKIAKLLKGSPKAPMPSSIKPMLCQLHTEVTTDPEYVHEIKWDGYRIISYIKDKKVLMSSRSGENYTTRYPAVGKALAALGHAAVLDGEMVVFDEAGKPVFHKMQSNHVTADSLTYCVFDILWLDGIDLTGMPVLQRKAVLKELVGDNKLVRYTDHHEDGPALIEEMRQQGMEGIVSKRKDSLYHPGDRRGDWRKSPIHRLEEFVIGGYLVSENGKTFSSLQLGAYQNGKFIWRTRSGGGYTETLRNQIMAKLKKIPSASCPFSNLREAKGKYIVTINDKDRALDNEGRKIYWVQPKIVARFRFSSWQESGLTRKPVIWDDWREDKKAKDVVVESPANAEKDGKQQTMKDAASQKESISVNNSKITGKKYPYLNHDSGWQAVDKEQQGAEWEQLELEHCAVNVHHLDRELWSGVTKGHLLLYYSQMKDYVLPYIKNHPQSLVLKLINAGASRTFIKDMENRQPSCATVFTDKRRDPKAGKRQIIDYLVVNNLDTLIYLIDLGAVDINVWASSYKKIEYPEYIWLDLDPTVPKELTGTKREKVEAEGFQKAIEIAQATKVVLDRYHLSGFVKTSGQTGIHIYIPCKGYDYDQVRTAAVRLADEVHTLVPKIGTRDVTIAHRGKNVYIDANQNEYAKTLASPYCVRPFHQPTISTPLTWDEVVTGLTPYAFTIDNIRDRVQRVGDIFKGVLDKKIIVANSKALRPLLHGLRE